MCATRTVTFGFVLLLLVAFAARIGVGCWWQARQSDDAIFFFGDSHSYWQLGRSIAQGEPYRYGERDVFRTPGLPLMLSPVFWLGGAEPSPMWGRVIVALTGTLSVAVTFWLGRVLFNSTTALLAATVMAIYPTNVFLGGMVLAEAPFAAAMLLQLTCWTLAWQRHEHSRSAYGWAIAAGVAAGIACLIRPSWLLFTPGAIVIAVACCADRWRQLLLGLTLLSVLIVVMSPWWLRNYRVTDRFVPTTLQVGASLVDSLSPTATGASDMEFVEQSTTEFQHDWQQAPPPNPSFEVYADQRFRQQAIAFAQEDPARALHLAGIKFARTWSAWPNADEFQSIWMRLVLLLSYTPLMVLAALGVWRFRSHGWPILLCCLPAVYFAALHMVFVGSIRYREPALMPLAVLAAAWLVSQFLTKDGQDFSADV